MSKEAVSHIIDQLNDDESISIDSFSTDAPDYNIPKVNKEHFQNLVQQFQMNY
jgi:hypothetical protein